MSHFEKDVIISGIGISHVGRRTGIPGLDLTLDAARAALADAGLVPADIDGIATLGDTPRQDRSSGFDTAGLYSPLMSAFLAVSKGRSREVLVYRTVSRADMGITGWVTLTIAQAGNDEQRERWDAEAFRLRVPGPHFDPAIAGAVAMSTGDVVSSAPELARLSLNIAATHHDSRVGGQRLVYGGHTIGLALAQVTRLLPNLVTVLGWQSCDHTGPVHEGDTLVSEVHVEEAQPLSSGRGGILRLRSLVYVVPGGSSAATRGDAAGEPDRQVLDWRFSALQF